MREKVKECLLERIKYSRNLQITLAKMLRKYVIFFRDYKVIRKKWNKYFKNKPSLTSVVKMFCT